MKSYLPPSRKLLLGAALVLFLVGAVNAQEEGQPNQPGKPAPAPVQPAPPDGGVVPSTRPHIWITDVWRGGRRTRRYLRVNVFINGTRADVLARARAYLYYARHPFAYAYDRAYFSYPYAAPYDNGNPVPYDNGNQPPITPPTQPAEAPGTVPPPPTAPE